MIQLQPLTELDAATVAQNRAEAVAAIQAENPSLDLRRGVFADLLVYYHAVLTTQRQKNIADYWNARSLKAIEADPALADPDLVDDVLSNFRLTRKEGSFSSGEVIIVLSDDVTVTIAKGAIWRASGQDFVTERVYVAKTEAAQINDDGDRLIAALAEEGRFAFSVPVVAVTEGPAGNVTRGTLVVPVTAPPNYVTSHAASDFIGGLATETNAELLSRLQDGIAARALSNRVNMRAMLREVDAFSRVVATSIIGFGDAEMLRDRHGIFPVSTGGRVDWYVRTQERAVALALTRTAVLVEKLADDRGIWQFALGRDDAPGFYEVVNIRPAGTGTDATGGFAVTEDIRSVDLTGGGFLPDVATPAEGAYSRFQTAVIRFKDTETPVASLAPGATRDCELEVVYLPLIADMQAYVSSRDVRSYGADCLVKAPVPCFLSLGFAIHKAAGAPDPDVVAIKDALAASVNTVTFVGALYASRLQEVIYNLLPPEQSVGAIDMFGRLRRPDGVILYVRSGEVLEVPNDPANMVSAQTVQFFLQSEDVALSVMTSVPTPL